MWVATGPPAPHQTISSALIRVIFDWCHSLNPNLMAIRFDLWTLTFLLKELGFSDLSPQTVKHFLQRGLASNQAKSASSKNLVGSHSFFPVLVVSIYPTKRKKQASKQTNKQTSKQSRGSENRQPRHGQSAFSPSPREPREATPRWTSRGPFRRPSPPSAWTKRWRPGSP